MQAEVPKRAFDLLIATGALLLLFPFLLIVGAWVKLDSPGPALFRQQRVGRRGELFVIHKFRTMSHQTAGLELTVGADKRVTRAGAFLRRTRIDELPQLIDVVLGYMSLVGPRPEVPRYVAHYPTHLRAKALAVRPGMTDPASLAFIDEAALLAASSDPERTYIDEVVPAKVALAVAYAQQATLASDLRVLWKTARLLLKRGAL